jgi:hypothetical protein
VLARLVLVVLVERQLVALAVSELETPGAVEAVAVPPIRPAVAVVATISAASLAWEAEVVAPVVKLRLGR